MSSVGDEPSCSGGFHSVHAERDPEANWAVDIDNLLEEYLAKICAGEIPSEDDDRRIRVNFAEAALLLQGSVQVYSRKVEYLYSLVLHVLEFISQQRQHDQVDGATGQPDEAGPSGTQNEDDDPFWVSDDIPVDAKNRLDSSTDKDIPSNQFVRPPVNLVVLEGDCLDTSGDSGELESYLLATHDFFEDFILLDSSDALVVNDFLRDSKVLNGRQWAGSARKTFQSPRSRSGANVMRSSVGKNQRVNVNEPPGAASKARVNDIGLDPPACDNFPHEEFGFSMDNGCFEPGSISDDDDDNQDPWKPLNPHESGDLKVKPFKKVKSFKKPIAKTTRTNSIVTHFPLATPDGPINPEFKEIWKTRCAVKKQHEMDSPPPYEKLRQSLINGGCEVPNVFGNSDDGDEDHGDDGGFADFADPDTDMPGGNYMDEDVRHNEMNDGAAPFDNVSADGTEDPLSQASLEYLCRSHLDALLASIAETENQTELAARVATWKLNIEQNLEEQDRHPPFDIHDYGERILTKLSLQSDLEEAASFADVVQGQEKHDVARSFSALLQLVNNRDVDLDKGKAGSSSQCFTATNPFYVRLCNGRRQGEAQAQYASKRATSPIQRGHIEAETNQLHEKEPQLIPRSKSRQRESPSRPKFTLKAGKMGSARCTPEGKKRRKSRFVEPVNLHHAG